MAYDEVTAGRVRRILANRSNVVEKGMVGGGLGFMVDGHLCCGVRADGLTVRVGREGRAAALTEPHVGPLVLGKREPAAFVVVEPPGYRSDADLEAWIARALAFIATL
jgi:hypothetical protein